MQFLARQNQDSTNTGSDDEEIYLVDPYILISILLETLSYGIFLVLFLLSTALLLRRRRALLRGKVIEPVKLRSLEFYLAMSMLMFLAITAKWSFWWAEALPIPRYQGPGVTTQLPRLGRNVYRMKSVCIRITVLLGDIITIYRLWILSDRNKLMVAFPAAGFIGFLTCAIELSGRAKGVVNSLIPIENGRLRPSGWHIGAITCTTSITVYVTLMIAWIITKAQMRAGARVLGHGVRQVLAVIIESAALYTIWNLFFFITGLGLKSKIALAFLDCVPAIYGISLMLINVRVGLGWGRYDGPRGAIIAPINFAGGENGRRNFPACNVPTEAYSEFSGRSCAQVAEDVELGDARSVALSATVTTPGRCSGDSEAGCNAGQSLP